MTAQFDASSYAQDLEAAGVPKAQAEVHAKALAHVISDCTVSPADLAATEQRLLDKMAALRQELLDKISSLENEFRTEIRTLKWMNGVTLALVLALYPLVIGLYIKL